MESQLNCKDISEFDIKKAVSKKDTARELKAIFVNWLILLRALLIIHFFQETNRMDKMRATNIF